MKKSYEALLWYYKTGKNMILVDFDRFDLSFILGKLIVSDDYKNLESLADKIVDQAKMLNMLCLEAILKKAKVGRKFKNSPPKPKRGQSFQIESEYIPRGSGQKKSLFTIGVEIAILPKKFIKNTNADGFDPCVISWAYFSKMKNMPKSVGLLKKEVESVWGNKTIILGFAPLRKKSGNMRTTNSIDDQAIAKDLAKKTVTMIDKIVKKMQS